MGVLEFQKLPVNTLVGADWKTFKGITQGQTIGAEMFGGYVVKHYFCIRIRERTQVFK